MNEGLKNVLDRRLSALAWDDRRSQQVLRQIRGETKVKKKMSFGLVMAMALILVAGIAIAAITINRSPAADIINQARTALEQKYGMTPAALGVMFPKAEQAGDQWTVTFLGGGMPEGLVGEYTVVIKKDAQPEASWSHDNADKALLDSGSLDSPAWGVKQIQKALTDTAAREAAIQKHLKENPDLIKHAQGLGPTPAVENPQDGDRFVQGKHMREGKPGEGDLTQEKALEIAKAALMDEFKLSRETLDRAELTDAIFLKAVEGDKTAWSLHFYVVDKEVELGLGVLVDAKTGELLNIGITTGGNG